MICQPFLLVKYSSNNSFFRILMSGIRALCGKTDTTSTYTITYTKSKSLCCHNTQSCNYFKERSFHTPFNSFFFHWWDMTSRLRILSWWRKLVVLSVLFSDGRPFEIPWFSGSFSTGFFLSGFADWFTNHFVFSLSHLPWDPKKNPLSTFGSQETEYSTTEEKEEEENCKRNKDG